MSESRKDNQEALGKLDFWNSDLKDVEGCFLQGKKVTDLEVAPPRPRLVNVDHVVALPGKKSRMLAEMGRLLGRA